MSASSLSPVTDTSGLSCTPNPVTLFDFTTIPDLSLWEESSDTVRTQGMSKASFNLQKTQIFQVT